MKSICRNIGLLICVTVCYLSNNISSALPVGARPALRGPVAIDSLGREWALLSLRDNRSLDVSNALAVWGDPFGYYDATLAGQLRALDPFGFNKPTVLPSPSDVIDATGVQLNTFFEYAIVLDARGQLWGFGENYKGALGDTASWKRPLPFMLSIPGRFKRVASQFGRVAAIRADGTVWTWGEGDPTARPATTIRDAIDVAVTGHTVVALSRTGTVEVAGVPKQAAGLPSSPALMIDAVGPDPIPDSFPENIVVLLRSGEIYQSRGAQPFVAVPAPPAIFVSAYRELGFAILNDGTVWVWGPGSGKVRGVIGPNDDPQTDAPGRITLKVGSSESINLVVRRPTAAGTAVIEEFYHPRFDHYFLSAVPEEIVNIERGGVGLGWFRTGYSFKAWATKESAPVDAKPVCRFFAAGPTSHFYTADVEECTKVKAWETQDRATLPAGAPYLGWSYEGVAFYIRTPTGGVCPQGHVTISRIWNNPTDPNANNHSYTPFAHRFEARTLLDGWTGEGPVFCAPE